MTSYPVTILYIVVPTLVNPMTHNEPKNIILIIFAGAFHDIPLTLIEQIIGTKNCIDVAFSPPRIPSTADTFGNTIAKKHVTAMNIPVHTRFSFYENVSLPQNT